MPDGKVTLELIQPSLPLIQTRAADEEETIETVTVFVFDVNGNKTSAFTQHSANNIRYIDVYLTDADQDVYVVCNDSLPERLLAEVNGLDDLRNRELSITSTDGAYRGNYVMTGHTTVNEVKGNNPNTPPNRKINLYRLASHLNFTIKVDTSTENNGDGGTFKLANVYICNVPMGSFLLDGAERPTGPEQVEGSEGTTVPGEPSDPGEPGCKYDYPYSADPLKMRSKYFEPIRLDVTEETDAYTATFDMFENRRGAVEDIKENWPELSGLEEHTDYLLYKQMYKRNRAMDYPNNIGSILIGEQTTNEELYKLESVQKNRFFNATYLRIDGVYQRADGRTTFENSYYVYLGADSYKDFNVRRNHLYNHEIIIRGYKEFDHRVTGKPLNDPEMYANLDDLDAHFNVVKALLFAPDDWTVSVKNPDETPWLEVSHSAVYKPHLQGKELTGDEAAFSIQGLRGLHYFYVHTDEYIPDIDQPYQNLHQKSRKGILVYRCGGKEKEYEVEQQPAQIVILSTNFDPEAVGEIRDTFFIERNLEQKYIPWGFYRYWSHKTDTLIGFRGTWDGLMNTRALYDVALNGDRYLGQDIPPAYPDGIPYDHALGYIISKNRDRNGNGKIDPDEIVWYWPAKNELRQIRETKFDALLHFEGHEETFFASTPSSSDKYGVTPGLAVRLKMNDDSPWQPVSRDRKYNVIACRRKDAWKGPNSGQGGGGVFTDPDWDEGDEVILPKGN